jgi:hypothetical protein
MIGTMKLSEWLDVAADLQARWAATVLSPETVQRWGEDLADLPAAHVAAAVAALGRTDREFAPNSGVIRTEVIRLRVDAPEWAEALADLVELAATPVARAVEVDVDHEENRATVRREYPRAELLATKHPLLATFIDVVSWEQIRPAVDADRPHRGNEEARLRDKWQAFVGRLLRDEALEGLAPGSDLPALNRRSRRRAPRSIAEAVGDVVPQLPRGD